MHETHSVNAGTVARGWLEQATSALDDRFGDGFALENPELVGAFMKAAGSAAIASALRDIGASHAATLDSRLRDITRVLGE